MHPGSGINPDDSRLANSNVAQLPRNAAGLVDHSDKSVALFLRTHRGTTADWRPDGRDHRADRKPVTSDLVGQALDVFFVRIDRRVWIGKKEVDAFEFRAIGPRGRGQLEHGVEVDRRL